MKQIDTISMEELLKKTNCILRKEDIILFCNDDETIRSFMNDFGNQFNSDNMKKFLIEHEGVLDKRKLVFLLAMNYRENLSKLEELIKKDEENNDIKQYKEHYKQYLIQNKYKEEAEKLAKGVDVYLYSNVVEKEGIVDYVDVLSSKEWIDNKKNTGKKQKDRYDKINNAVKDKNGFIYVIQSILLTDLADIICSDPQFGAYIREAILNNVLVKKELATKEELDYLRQNDMQEYINIIDNVENSSIPFELSDMLEKHIKYIDIDKLLLTAAYRYEEALENNIMPKETIPTIKILIGIILDNIDKKSAHIEGKLQAKNNNELVDVSYKYSDANELFDRIQGEKYFSKEELNYTKTMILENQMSISTIPETTLFLYKFTKEQLMDIMVYSKDNFEYVSKILELDEETIISQLSKLNNEDKELVINLKRNGQISEKSIIDMFYKGKISAEFFKEFSEEISFSSEINLHTINELYNKIKNSKKENKEDTEKLNKQIELYKLLNVDGKNKEELEEHSNNLMYEIAENFDNQEDLLFYYRQGLITLNTVVDWSGEQLIDQLYQKSEITFQDLENLYSEQKISQSLIEKIILSNKEIDYAELMAYIYLGYLSEEKIIDLYMQGKIFDVDLENITRQGKISVQRYAQATLERTKEKLEENSKIKLELINIPNKKDIHGIIIKQEVDTTKDTSYQVSIGKNKILIDPIARYQYLDLLGAKEAKAIIPDEDNAFYNYEFFVIPDSNGELQANSVVIAERIWEDKEDQTKGLATENATYFFQYKDLMVNSNLSKKEMTKEREKVISTANHRIGSWAVSVLYRIAQTTKSSNLKEYKKGDERATVVIDELLKIYTDEQLGKILKMAGEIDDAQKYVLEEMNTVKNKKEEVENSER